MLADFGQIMAKFGQSLPMFPKCWPTWAEMLTAIGQFGAKLDSFGRRATFRHLLDGFPGTSRLARISTCNFSGSVAGNFSAAFGYQYSLWSGGFQGSLGFEKLEARSVWTFPGDDKRRFRGCVGKRGRKMHGVQVGRCERGVVGGLLSGSWTVAPRPFPCCKKARRGGRDARGGIAPPWHQVTKGPR